MRGRRSLLVCILASASFCSPALAAESLTALPANVQDDIKTVCLPVQFQEGAEAYRECVNNEISTYSGIASVPVANLSFDDKYAVQQACAKTGPRDSATYLACERQQVSELNALPVPVLNDLSDDEQYALQQTCFEAQSRLGAGPYRRCVNGVLAELRQLPKANFAGLSQVAQNGIQLRCSANHRNVVDYRKCLLEAVGSVAAPTAASSTIVRQERDPVVNTATSTNSATTTDTPTDTPIVQTQPTPSAVQDVSERSTIGAAQPTNVTVATSSLANGDQLNVVPAQQATVLTDASTVTSTESNVTATTRISDSTSVDSTVIGIGEDVTQAQTASESAPVSNESPSPVGIRDRIVDSWLNFKSTVLELEGTTRILVLSALALPLLLIIAWAFMRKRSGHETYYESEPRNTDLLDRIHPEFDSDEQQRFKNRLDAEADEFFSTIDAEGIYDETPDTREITEPVGLRQQRKAASDFDESPHPSDRATEFGESTKPESETATRFANKQEKAAAASVQEYANNGSAGRVSQAADRNAFALWLARATTDDQLSYTIEFLIYWIAYGDERYDPALKEVLFQLQDPDDHDLIKRWVLKHDVMAFRDTVNWIQRNTDLEQRRQIIDLLMVVLINERALTPVQNTLLRFLGDAFGISNAELDIQYREAYGMPMAPLPRVDKPKWWQRQNNEDQLRWDARAVTNEPLDLQYRVRLGLELDGPIDEESVVKGFRRAARRCHPDRFDALTERERELAEIQFEKFEEARDFLLGVDA